MCVIIIKEKSNLEIKTDTLIISSILNPDGLGILWLDNYKVEYFESSQWNKLLTNRPFIAHFRYATVGGIGIENMHPFKINGNEYLFQNGTNYNLGNRTMTDTEHLANILSKCEKSTWRYILEMTDSRYITANVKKKSFEIYNKELWKKDNGVLFSKDNVIDKTILAVYGTLKKGGSNNHLLDRATFLCNGKTYDKYPMLIDGIPYVLPNKGKGHNINVELFLLSNKTLKSIDILEGHPQWYNRKRTQIMTNNGIITAWLYFNETADDTGVYYKNFEIKNKKSNYSKDLFNDFDIYDKNSNYNWYDKIDEIEADNNFERAYKTCPYCNMADNIIFDEYDNSDYCLGCDNYIN